MFSKDFIIFFFFALAVGYITKSWINFLIIGGVFAIAKILWKTTIG